MRYKLKEGAVPHKFSSLSSNMRKHLDNSNADNSVREVDFIHVAEMESPSTEIPNPYLSIREHIKDLTIPNNWWAIHCAPSFIVCAKWDVSPAIEKQIFIMDDMTIKV